MGDIEPGTERLPPMHPGEMLREEFVCPLGLNAAEVAGMIGVSAVRIEHLLNEKGRISAMIALRLGRLFGTTPQLWMNLQSRYDLERAANQKSARSAGWAGRPPQS
jgi:addiction module HigA family antidote